MAPRDVVVEADEDHRNAEERGAADVELARNRELRLVEAVRPAPVPVRVAEEQRAAVTGGGGAEADHVAAHALLAADLQLGHVDERRHLQRGLLRAAARSHLGGRRRCGCDRIGDVRQEVAVAAREVGRVHAAVDVLGRDGLHPGFVAAGLVRRAAGLHVAHVAVVASGEALDQLLQVVGLGGDHLREHVGRDHLLVEEVGVDVLRPRDGAAGHELRIAAEVLRTLAAVGEEGVGHRAQVVFRLRETVAVAHAGPVVGLDVRHAQGGAADLGLVAAFGRRVGGRGAADGKEREPVAASTTATAGGERGRCDQREQGQRHGAARGCLSHGCLRLMLS
ncbi:hypothetical protein D3C85_983200 [compost metagenome]